MVHFDLVVSESEETGPGGAEGAENPRQGPDTILAENREQLVSVVRLFSKPLAW